MNEEYWKKKDLEAQERNEVTFVRFGAHGAQGSVSWVKGQKLKPWQKEKLALLLSGDSSIGIPDRHIVDQQTVEDDFSDMY